MAENLPTISSPLKSFGKKPVAQYELAKEDSLNVCKMGDLLLNFPKRKQGLVFYSNDIWNEISSLDFGE